VELVPTVVREFRANLARGEERDALCRRMRELCEELGTRVEHTSQGLRLRPQPAT